MSSKFPNNEIVIVRSIQVLFVQSLLGLGGLLLLPAGNSAAVLGLSGQRLILVLVALGLSLFGLMAQLRLRTLAPRLSKWFTKVKSEPGKLLVVTSISLVAFLTLGFLFTFLFLASASYHPLLLRLLSVGLPFLSLTGFQLYFLFGNLTDERRKALIEGLYKIFLVTLTVLGISGLVVYFQIRWQGWEWVETSAVETHTYVMEGIAGSPRQFRVLPEYLVTSTRILLDQFGIDASLEISMIVWRFMANVCMLTAALVYYRKLGLKLFTAVLAIGVIGLTLTDAINGSNLATNTYFDVTFYLLAGYAILAGKPRWLIPIVFLAASNRETSGFIPFMLLADYFYNRDNYKDMRAVLGVVALSGLAYLLVFIGLRLLYPTDWMLIPDGVQPGIELLAFNLSKSATWIQLFITFGILPFLALYAFRHFPHTLKAFAVLIVPAWFVIHFFVSVIAESRLLLVPYALVVIPGVFWRVTND